MVGLPTETDEDLEEMVALVERIKDRMLEAGNVSARRQNHSRAERLCAEAEHAFSVGADLRRERIEAASEVGVEKSRADSERRSARDVGAHRARAGVVFLGRPSMAASSKPWRASRRP